MSNRRDHREEKVMFIAISNSFVGGGSNPEEALCKLQSILTREGFDFIAPNTIEVFEVLKKGKAKLTVDWIK